MENSQIDMTQLITDTLNTLFNNLFASIDNTVYPFLDDITFINSSIQKDSYFEKLLGTSASNGVLLVANSLLIAFLLYYAIRFFISIYTSSSFPRPYQFLFRFLILGILMNSSYFIGEQLLDLNSFLSSSIRNIGEQLFQKSICFTSLIDELNSVITLDSNSINIFSVDGILKSFVSIGLLNLIFSYSLRYIMIKVFLLISPFAFLSLSLDTTSWFFKTWLRSFLSFLLLQVFISFILLIIFSLNFSDNLFSKFTYVGAIYALMKANSYIRDMFGGISTDFSNNISNFTQLFK